MKKVLIGLLILILIALGINTIINGMEIGSLNVLGYENIRQKNNELDQKIEEAATLTGVTFPEKLGTLNTDSNKLKTVKEQYQDKIAYSSEENVQKAQTDEIYQVDFLFTRLGNYAKKNGVTMALSAKFSSSTNDHDIYDLNFIVNGKYSLIADFIREIENDSRLKFTIEDFSLAPNAGTNTENLRADFVVRGLILEVDENTQTSYSTQSDNPNIVDSGSNKTTNANSSNSSNKNNTTNNANSKTQNSTSVPKNAQEANNSLQNTIDMADDVEE